MTLQAVSNVITSDPDILEGVPVFKGTRVPVEILFEYLQYSTIEEFLKGYPQVSRPMINAVLDFVASQFTQQHETAA